MRHDSDTGFWRSLQIFNLYRFGLAASLVNIEVFYLHYIDVLSVQRDFFFRIDTEYLFFSLICVFLTRLRLLPYAFQVRMQALGDIVFLTLLMHASSGSILLMGLLMNIAIAGNSILIGGRSAVFFAFLGSIAIFYEHFYSSLFPSSPHVYYQEVAVIGVTFFATALMGHSLSKRIRSTEDEAESRRQDVLRLGRLNAHIINRIRSGVLVLNADECIEYLNPSAQRLLQVSSTIGQSLQRISPVLHVCFSAWRVKQETESRPVTLHDQSVLMHASQVGLEGYEGYILFLEDATRSKEQAQKMKLASLGGLTASIAHEIRNPLSSISYAAQLLEESPRLNTEDLRLTAVVNQQAQRMNNIVQTILNLSQKKDPKRALFPLKPWLENFIQSTLLMSFPEAMITLDAEEVGEAQVRVQHTHLMQVLTNLCENGLRYSKKATAKQTLSVYLTRESALRAIHLDIVDQGPGVSEEMQPHLFEPFASGEHNGTGLGLYIAKELCEINQVQLNYVSTHERGHAFRMTFPEVLPV